MNGMNASPGETPGINLPAPAAQNTGGNTGGPPPNPPKTDDTSTTQPAAPPAADDTDLIEKEWVNKARQVVARHRDDPYKQSQELTKLKADYMKQRYNKVIKISK